LLQQKASYFKGIAVDGLHGFDAVGNACRITEIDDVFEGQPFREGSYDGQTADA